MAKEIIWSPLAKRKRRDILQYWIDHNKSNAFSIKLNDLIKQSEQLIAKYPNIGKPTNQKNIRFKIVRDYLIFYEVIDDKIHILTIWDNRQDPEKLTLK